MRILIVLACLLWVSLPAVSRDRPQSAIAGTPVHLPAYPEAGWRLHASHAIGDFFGSSTGGYLNNQPIATQFRHVLRLEPRGEWDVGMASVRTFGDGHDPAVQIALVSSPSRPGLAAASMVHPLCKPEHRTTSDPDFGGAKDSIRVECLGRWQQTVFFRTRADLDVPLRDALFRWGKNTVVPELLIIRFLDEPDPQRGES